MRSKVNLHKKHCIIAISLILLCCKEEKQAKLLDEKESKESLPCHWTYVRSKDFGNFYYKNIPKMEDILFLNSYFDKGVLWYLEPSNYLEVEYELIEDESDLLREYSDSYFRSKKEIMEYLRENDIIFRGEYRDYLKISPCFNGKIVLKFVIEGYSGRVREAVILSSTTELPNFDEKIRKTIERYYFIPSKKPNNTTVAVAFYFLERLNENKINKY